MVYRWNEYYDEAKKKYEKENGKPTPLIDLYDLTAKVQDPRNKKEADILTLEEPYMGIIDSLAKSADEAFKDSKNYERRGMAHGIKNIWDFPQLRDLSELLVPQMEEKVFGSYVQVDNIKIYRSYVSGDAPISSWLWHFDNNPKEQIKILIYLTDVDEGSGQFEFIMNPETKEGVKVPTSRAAWDSWTDTNAAEFALKSPFNVEWKGVNRVPPGIVDRYITGGYKNAKVLGERGKLILFDNNIVHRASPARKQHRDIVMLEFKPSTNKVEPVIDETTTGSWDHIVLYVDPNVPKVLPVTEENAAMNQLGRIQDSAAYRPWHKNEDL